MKHNPWNRKIQLINIFFSERKYADDTDKSSGQKFRGKNGYVPRADRYSNLLDTAYSDIVEKRKSAPLNLEQSKKGEKKQDNVMKAQNQPAPVTSKTPTVSLKLIYDTLALLQIIIKSHL